MDEIYPQMIRGVGWALFRYVIWFWISYTQIFSQISVKKDTAHNGNYLNELRSLFNIELLN